MSEDTARPIIIVKKKVNAAGHHGGAWKVAYADFVTAMMAFFMVMWLVASLNKEQRSAMFKYFNNPSMEQGHSVKAAPGQAGPGGASSSVINLGGGLDAPKIVVDTRKAASSAAEAKQKEQKEKEQLESLLEELKQATSLGQALEPFKDQLLLDITPEGLRIQIVDKQNRPMFDTGSSALKDYQVSERSPQPHQSVRTHGCQTVSRDHPVILELGVVGGSCERGTPRAHRRRPGREQDCTRRRTCLLGAVRQGRAAQSHQSSHQHHRHDSARRRCGAVDRCPVGRHPGSR
jgi:hypothetical protein